MKKAIYLLVMLSLLISTARAQELKPDSLGYLVKVGQQAPNFKMKLTTGDTIELAKLKGKVVLLQFTASWCRVCREEMPHIEKEIWQKHKERNDFSLFGVDRDEPLETVTAFAKQVGVTYPMGLDPKANIFGLFADKKAGITRNILIDKEGRIVMLTRLFNEKEFSALCQKIDLLLTP